MDIVDRLRATDCDREPFTPEHAACKCLLANAAADEIERLRKMLSHQLPSAVATPSLPWVQTVTVYSTPEH